MHPALVVFDLDGTLIDSAPDMHRAVNLLLNDLGRPPLSLREIRTMVGDGAAALIARALAARHCVTADPDESLAQFLRYYAEEPTAATRVFPGVPETLERLHAAGLTLAVCTNKPGGLTHTILERLQVGRYFDRVVAGDTLPYRKPDPRALLSVLESFGTPEAASLLVGDSEVDAATASAAQVPFVLMTYGYHRGPVEEIASVATLDDFPELATLLHA
ncbi:MAG TPA: phosphoglycolate phosphatase [Steroidobacteraceae bacterium]|nr:phosphoglycolate phosphatase [Steroidobacteraceae bacterium]